MNKFPQWLNPAFSGALFAIGLVLLMVNAAQTTAASSLALLWQQSPTPQARMRNALYFVSVTQAASQQSSATSTGPVNGAPKIKRVPAEGQQVRGAEVADATTSPLLPSDNCEISGLHGSPNSQRVMVNVRCLDRVGYTKALEVTTGQVRNVEPKPEQESIFLNWTPDGHSVILRVDPLVSNDIVLVNMDSGKTEKINTPPFTYDATLSPSDQRVLYTVNRGMGHGGELWIMNRDGSNKRLIVDDPKYVFAYPRWSPKGEAIAYIRMPDTNIPFTVGELWLADQDGQHRQMIAEADAGHGYPSAWSPDGKYIAFVVRENPRDIRADNLAEELESNIYLFEAQSANVRPLTQFKGATSDGIAWSPNSTQLAFRTTVDGVSDIWLADVRTGELQQTTRGADANYPVWLGDGGTN